MIVFEVWSNFRSEIFVHSIVHLARLLIQFLNGILTGPLSRNADAYQTLKDLFTNNCHLRYDELNLILENIFRFLNRDEDETAATAVNTSHRSPHQQPIKVE